MVKRYAQAGKAGFSRDSSPCDCPEIEKRDIVKDKHERKNVVSRLGELVEETNTRIYAWALMSNHMHILLKSGPRGLSHFMRRFLTGYAVTFNLRHRRNGHLFQNRYKSIVCDEDAYFQELGDAKPRLILAIAARSFSAGVRF